MMVRKMHNKIGQSVPYKREKKTSEMLKPASGIREGPRHDGDDPGPHEIKQSFQGASGSEAVDTQRNQND
jgi:hypothetical protein